MTPKNLEISALPGIPLVAPGDDLARLIVEAMERAQRSFAAGDILVVAQKIVSKAEGRYATLGSITPSERALTLAAKVDKDPRLVELILGESARVLRYRPGLLIVEHRLGYVMANAGIDASNVEPEDGAERFLLLPDDPDASCHRLRDGLHATTGIAPAVIINDSVGRAWRHGTIGTALGAAGLHTLLDLRGEKDLFGRALRVSQVGLADELAAAASLVQGEGAEGTPVALIRGFTPDADQGRVADLLRGKEEDLFR
ncbi:MAG: coenzyme F420-0:L-glutamate ligase [Alphaproteobacteria bacterium]|nr:coenzyme F420-0:L-glutamate ligase [Alphaproteobacteria bacterium]